MKLKGMVVELGTASRPGSSGTDDHLYVGVVGPAGGREFPLATEAINDFEEGSNVIYWLGTVWDGTLLGTAVKPDAAHGGNNDPQTFNVDMDQIDYVYLRKAGSLRGGDDDAWKLNRIRVHLFGDSPRKRSFGADDDLWLGNEFGQQAWLPEIRTSIRGGLAEVKDKVLVSRLQPAERMARERDADADAALVR